MHAMWCQFIFSNTQCDDGVHSTYLNYLIFVFRFGYRTSGFNLNGTLYDKLSIQRETNEAT